MKVYQNVERFGFRLEFSMQTLDASTHKLISESPEIEVQMRNAMADAGDACLEILKGELDRRFPEGLK